MSKKFKNIENDEAFKNFKKLVVNGQRDVLLVVRLQVTMHVL